jgi:hypothetical protein
MLEDKGRREQNTVAGSRCCSDLCCKKTEEKSIRRLFKFDGELNRELNGEFLFI